MARKGSLKGRGELNGSTRGILSGVPSITQLIVFRAGDDVEVKVRHGLPCNGALIEQHIEAFGLRYFENGATKEGKSRSHLRTTLRWEIGQSGVVLTGYDQKVTVGEWADIQECDDRIVLVDHGGGEFGGDDLAEDTGLIAHHASTVHNRPEHPAHAR